MDDLEKTASLFWSERLPQFRDALEILYIKGNRGGRLGFLRDWADAAQWMLGPELIAVDLSGTQDVTARGVFEDAAEARRLEILGALKGLEEKAVVSGSVQIEFVTAFIQHYGPGVSAAVFSEKIIARFNTLK